MKKKVLECDIHGPTLFRCKRRWWKRGSKREKSCSDEYTEKCFRCISEGRYKKDLRPKSTKKKHFKIE